MIKYLPVFACLIHIVLSSVVQRKDYYRAAVFEHSNDKDGSLEEILRFNFEAYEAATRIAAENGADIIVLPESGLYSTFNFTRNTASRFSEQIPDPKIEVTNPCKESQTFFDRPVLFKLSCLAQKNKIYLVANVIDFNKCSVIEPCNGGVAEFCTNQDCPDDGFLLYNTNVVFDREGTLIAKYYKKHLYFEYDKNVPKNPEDVFFDTDFGKFTTFVCFDLVFNESAKVVEKSGVRNVAYTTYWFDHFPLMYFATAYQQAWAMDNNVNLLAANAHSITTGSLGSGIYSGPQGALVYTHNPDNSRRLLISNVPKVPSEEFQQHNVKRFILDGSSAVEEKEEKSEVLKSSECDVSGPLQDLMHDYRCSTMNTTNYKYVKLTKPEDKIEVCANNICCNLWYKFKYWKEDYFLGIYDNIQYFYDKFAFGTEGCFLLRCDTLGSKECKRFVLKSETVFDYVNLKGNFSAKHILPYALDSGIRLTDKSQWSVKGKHQILYENRYRNSSLLFLALYGRHYENDIDLLNWV